MMGATCVMGGGVAVGAGSAAAAAGPARRPGAAPTAPRQALGWCAGPSGQQVQALRRQAAREGAAGPAPARRQTLCMAKPSRSRRGGGGPQGSVMPGKLPSMEEMLPKHEAGDPPQFVLMVQSPGVLGGQWLPVSVIGAGTQAQAFCQALRRGWMKDMAVKSLQNNIAAVIYRDQRKILKGLKKAYPPFANVTKNEVNWGFKVQADELNDLPVYSIPTQEELDQGTSGVFRKIAAATKGKGPAIAAISIFAGVLLIAAAIASIPKTTDTSAKVDVETVTPGGGSSSTLSSPDLVN